jgi:hypothetical protein
VLAVLVFMIIFIPVLIPATVSAVHALVELRSRLMPASG